MNKLLLYILPFWLLSCEFTNESQKQENVFDLGNLPVNRFLISAIQDTILEGSKGIKVIVESDAFLYDSKVYKDSVQLELIEVLTKQDMVLAGMSTITTKGQLLESGGMLKLTVKSLGGKSLQLIEGKVKIEIPTKAIKPDMMLFSSQESENGQITWEMKDTLPNTPLTESIQIGKSLFEGNCIECHGIIEEVVGPRLGNITQKRSADWLLSFTKYPQCMIEMGDSISVCLYDKYQQYMPNYDFLSDEEINSIYTYIDNESKLNQTYLDSLDLVDTLVCVTRFPISDPRYFTTVSYVGTFQDEAVTDCAIMVPDSFVMKTYEYTYPLNITELSWMNVDRFLKVYEPISFYASIRNKDVQIIQSALVLYNYNSVIIGYVNKQGLISFNFFGEEGKTPLPIGEPALIVVVAKNGNQYFYGIKELKISEGNYEVELMGSDLKSIREKTSEAIDEFLE